MCSCREDESKEDNEHFGTAAALKAFYHGNSQPETSDVVKIQAYLNGTDAIKDVSPQFIENVKIAIDKYQDNILVMAMLKSVVSEWNMFESHNFTKHSEGKHSENDFIFRWDF